MGRWLWWWCRAVCACVGHVFRVFWVSAELCEEFTDLGAEFGLRGTGEGDWLSREGVGGGQVR